MSWFKNLKIRTKLVLSFMLVILLLVVLAIISVVRLREVDATDTYALEYPSTRETVMANFRSDVRDMRRAVAAMSTFATTDDNTAIISYNNEAMAAFNNAVATLAEFERLTRTDPRLAQAEISDRVKNVELANQYLNEYKSSVLDPMYTAAMQSDHDLSLVILTDGAPIASSLRELVDNMLSTATELADDTSEAATDAANSAVMTLILISVFIIFVSFVMALFVSSIISKPIKQLVEVADNVAKGNLNVNIDTSLKDETGMLGKSFHSVVQNVNTMIMDIDTMHTMHEDGKMSERVDESRYQGAYQQVAIGVNDMVNSYVDMISDIFGVLTNYAAGSFAAKLKTYKGEKAVANEQMNIFRDTIQRIVNEIDHVAKDGADGKLNTRADTAQYTGDWQNIMLGLNKVMDAVIEPINEVQAALIEMSKGNFDASIHGNYRGSFLEMKNAMNNTIVSIAGYIREITEILGKVADGDLRVAIKREYIGQFNYIKDSINSIITTLHKTMMEILSASEQVLSGAKQISSSAMTLAEGASEQASAIEELTASVETINNQTQQNAANAANANELSDKSTKNAQAGNEEMLQMLTAMNGIKESSNNISKVIKAISDIAFQTNLLSLNASVEAARAGEHGKGFAVVAEEVRNLASRSQTSSNDTATLIEDSIQRVSEGTRIAQATASALNVIVENAGQVSDIILTIAEASRQQAEAVSQVSIGLNQISQVVQNNSSTSEESAAAAEELNSQAELLQQMVSYFKI